MNIYAPSYYKEFKCIANKCKHSCCIGWEIDIDEDTLTYYNELDGEIGDRIRKSVSGKNPHFELTKDERCPHLNQNGLCDIITKLGEDALCDICYDHPRFRNFYSDFTEMGLGLTCEATAEIILKSKGKFSLIRIDGTDDIVVTAEEKRILKERSHLVYIMTDRNIPIAERFKTVCDIAGINDDFDFKKWCEFLMTLEILDNKWQILLNDAQNSKTSEFSIDNIPKCLELPLEQLMTYFLYRHIPSAVEDGKITPKIRFCVFSCYMICALTMLQKSNVDVLEIMIDTARMYSSEIEYSDENPSLIIEKLS